jgi:hypothetical protein
VRVDPELLFEDPERAIALSVEDGRGLVIVEDQRLSGGDLVPGQERSPCGA